MAKPRKNYSGNNIQWHLVLFYVLIGAIILSLLYYSGILKFGGNNSSETREVEYYQ